jgi:hypothetical protein
VTKNKRRRTKPSKRAARPRRPNRQTTLIIKAHKNTFFLTLLYDDYATSPSKITFQSLHLAPRVYGSSNRARCSLFLSLSARLAFK